MRNFNELIIGLLTDDTQWRAELTAESIGWLPLADGAYLRVGKPDEEEGVITVVGVPDASMTGMNVLLLT